MNYQANERTNKGMNEQNNKQMNEQANKKNRTSKQMNEHYTNNQMKE